MGLSKNLWKKISKRKERGSYIFKAGESDLQKKRKKSKERRERKNNVHINCLSLIP